MLQGLQPVAWGRSLCHVWITYGYGRSLECRRVAASNMGLQVAIDLWVHGVADHVVLQAESAVHVVPQLATLAAWG